MCSIASHDPKHRTLGAVTLIARATEFTFSAADIDFANDALTYTDCIRRFFDESNKLVANGSLESSIAAGDFEICLAYSRQQYPHQRFLSRLWLFNLTEGNAALFNSQCFHESGFACRVPTVFPSVAERRPRPSRRVPTRAARVGCRI